MANNCFTMYKFVGERTKEFELNVNNTIKKHGGDDWLKWLATDLLGYTEEQICDGEIYVRGSVIFVDDGHVDTDTAWNPCNQLFYELAVKYDLDIYWMADERGCCGIWSNDVDHKVWDWKYVIYNGDNGDEEHFADEEQAVEWVNRQIADKNVPPITQLPDLEKEEYEDSDIFVTEVEYGEFD